jgi:hypothetical protein
MQAGQVSETEPSWPGGIETHRLPVNLTTNQTSARKARIGSHIHIVGHSRCSVEQRQDQSWLAGRTRAERTDVARGGDCEQRAGSTLGVVSKREISPYPQQRSNGGRRTDCHARCVGA